MPRLHRPGPQTDVSFAECAAAREAADRTTDGSQRYYKISDRYVAGVRFCPTPSAPECAFSLDVYTNDGQRIYSNTALMLPSEISKLAEFNHLCRQWVAGEIKVLPPSTHWMSEGTFQFGDDIE